MKIKYFLLCVAVFTTAATISPLLAQTPRTATGTAVVVNGFMVAVNLTDGGYGYTNTPGVFFYGGGGSGAQAFAIVSNGVVAAITVTSAGHDYFESPLVIISPPIPPPPPQLSVVSPALLLTFTNLPTPPTNGNFSYQFQIYVSNNWVEYHGADRMVDGWWYPVARAVPVGQPYRLVLIGLRQAVATAQVTNGFVVGATVTDSGSGYVTNPAVKIIGGGGNGAQATAILGNGLTSDLGSIIAINIINAGYGYTNPPDIIIDPPPPPAEIPPQSITITSGLLLNWSNLISNLPYQLQASDNLQTWSNATPEPYVLPYTNVTLFQFATNGMGFFRLQYLP